MQRHPELRWLASIILIVAVGAAVATSVSGVFRDKSALPATNPDQLVSQVTAPHLGGYSGTIVTRMDLGLPRPVRAALAEAVPIGGLLLQGSHTMRYWYGGTQQQRVAVVEQNAEQDVFRNGSNLLTWDTATRTVEHDTVADGSLGALPLTQAPPAALTPPQLAARMLKLAGDTSDTVLRSGDPVADRPTYELVVRPDTETSTIGEVHIDIDGTHAVPLAVRVYARGADEPAVDVSFTSISFTPPAPRNFTFTAPAGSRSRASLGLLSDALDDVALKGSGWETVAAYPASRAQGALLERLFGDAMVPVRGSWGSGRLFQSPVLSVLVTAKGPVLAGAVTPTVLYDAVG